MWAGWCMGVSACAGRRYRMGLMGLNGTYVPDSTSPTGVILRIGPTITRFKPLSPSSVTPIRPDAVTPTRFPSWLLDPSSYLLRRADSDALVLA